MHKLKFPDLKTKPALQKFRYSTLEDLSTDDRDRIDRMKDNRPSLLIVVGTVFFSVCLISGTIAHLQESDSSNNRHEHNQNEMENEVIVIQSPQPEPSTAKHQPRHVHIAYGNNATTEMVITWSTVDKTRTPFVEYGRHRLWEYRVEGSSTKFVDSGLLKLTQYIHRVTLTNLTPGTFYMYHCGSEDGISEIFVFTTMKSGTDWSPTLAVYGDLGNVNAQSLVRIQREVQLGVYDAILHVGDFAYDMETENGLVGDYFMDQIQPIAAYVPYMTCPGNHENHLNFAHYKNRFSMPGNAESMYYSFNMGPIHFVAISTEFYYYLEYGVKHVVLQYDWLVNDLKEANKPENRAERPWIITYGHRPMYCSNNNTDDCTKRDTRVRVGIPFLKMFGLEDLFMENGVDLVIWAHEHSYERMFPMYNFTVYNSTTEGDPYHNPKAMVHLTTGSAGCKERHDDFLDYLPEYTAFRSTDYGYSRLKAINKTHLYVEQVSEDLNGKVIDAFTIIRDNHEAYKIPSNSHGWF